MKRSHNVNETILCFGTQRSYVYKTFLNLWSFHSVHSFFNLHKGHCIEFSVLCQAVREIDEVINSQILIVELFFH
jgi:hypothetical protein